MDNKEWTVVGLGCLALSSLYYFFQQYSRESRHYKQRRREMQDSKSQSSTSNAAIDFNKIKDNQPTCVLLAKAHINEIPNDAFNLFYREIKRGAIPDILKDPFLESQTGGRFTITQNQR
jgi:hypothetical protein